MRYSVQDPKEYRDLIIGILTVMTVMTFWGALMATPVL